MEAGRLDSGGREPGWASCQAQVQSIHTQPVRIRNEVSMHSPLGLYFFFLVVLGIELRALCLLLSYVCTLFLFWGKVLLSSPG